MSKQFGHHRKWLSEVAKNYHKYIQGESSSTANTQDQLMELGARIDHVSEKMSAIVATMTRMIMININHVLSTFFTSFKIKFTFNHKVWLWGEQKEQPDFLWTSLRPARDPHFSGHKGDVKIWEINSSKRSLGYECWIGPIGKIGNCCRFLQCSGPTSACEET